jgi:hypothetical protein
MTYDRRVETLPPLALEPALQYARAYESFNSDATAMLGWFSAEQGVTGKAQDTVAEALNAHRDAVFAGDVAQGDETLRGIYAASQNVGVNTNTQEFNMLVMMFSLGASALSDAEKRCLTLLGSGTRGVTA